MHICDAIHSWMRVEYASGELSVKQSVKKVEGRVKGFGDGDDGVRKRL